MEKLRFGIVGCGRIAKFHAEAIKSCPNAELVAVSDVIEEKARKFSSVYGTDSKVDYYVNYKKMLERKDIDVVNICTPSGLHPIMGINTAKAGKHVIVEKPMGLSLESADRLIKTCENENVKLYVVLQNRFNAPIQRLKKAVALGRFGRLIMGSSSMLWNRNQEYYDEADWRGTHALDGGAFMNQSIHNLDLLLYMMGEPESVYAYTGTYTHDIEVEDTGVGIIRFRNGAVGSLEATTCVYPKNFEETLKIFGSHGSVEIGGLAVNKINLWRFADGFDSEEEVLASQNTIDPPTVYGFGHSAVISNMIDAIVEGKPIMTDGYEGRRSVELVLALYLSARAGKEVKFPLESLEMPALKSEE